MVNYSDVLGVLKLLSFDSQGLVVLKRSDYLFSHNTITLVQDY